MKHRRHCVHLSRVIYISVIERHQLTDTYYSYFILNNSGSNAVAFFLRFLARKKIFLQRVTPLVGKIDSSYKTKPL